MNSPTNSLLDGLKPIARLRSYDELIAVMKARIEEKHAKTIDLNAECDFPDRYAEKLLAPAKPKHLGAESFGALLDYLGLEMIIAARSDT